MASYRTERSSVSSSGQRSSGALPVRGEECGAESDAAPLAKVEVETAVVGMEEVIDDPFLYPLPFLLFPSASFTTLATVSSLMPCVLQ